jgi:two-component system chemotaxis response regulator CheB
MPRTRVLIVDDSAVMRQLLTEILSHDSELEVIGAAADPIAARDKIKALNPDVLTLDVEMPRMDGLSFLEKLMRARPMPVVMVSSLTENGAATTLRAMELGAVDFVTKPKIDVRTGTLEIADEIVQKVKCAARARVRSHSPHAPAAPRGAASAHPSAGALLKSTHKVIAVGASTGGTEALREFLAPLPSDTPGVVVVQHMPASFTRSFADRLNDQCAMRVKEASDGDRILPGHVLIAPGDFHMRVHRSGAVYSVSIQQDDPVNRHRPSVDVLFDSCAVHLGANVVGVILTGMGADGARGMLAMKKSGARTFAQDEATCVVYGMPREAVLAGGVDEILPLPELPAAALRAVAEEGR